MRDSFLRILFLNWRDSANPEAGGAETFTEEIGKRLVQFGNDVTIFSSCFDGCRHESERSGIKIVREGGKYSVYSRARRFVRNHVSDFDIIIDEINTIPFRIYKIAKLKPVVAVIHQLAREVWFYETAFPLNVIGYLALEPLWLRGYRRLPTVTVSDSTRHDLEKRGFKQVRVIHNGIGITPSDGIPQKEAKPVLIFVGRLVKSKLPIHAIEAFKRVKESLPDAELWVVGDGYLRPKLESRAVEGVRFFGRISENEKFDLMAKARVMLVPSVREGWGISVIEANAVGTSAVGYAVPGLVDSIVDGVTGLLVPSLRIPALADAAKRVLADSYATGKFSKNALDWSRRFSWDDAAKEFYNVLASAADVQ